MGEPSRRQFLATLSGTAIVAVSGCGAQSDDRSETSPTSSQDTPAQTRVVPTPTPLDGIPECLPRERSRPTEGNGSAEPPLSHPEFGGITTGMESSRLTRPIVTWIQSSERTDANLGFDSRCIDAYVSGTDFGQQGVLVVQTTVSNSCDGVDVTDVAVESDRIVAETVHERFESRRDTCSDSPPFWPAWAVGFAVRVPVQDDRQLVVLQRDGTRWSNHYRVTLERVDNERIFEQFDVTFDREFRSQLDSQSRRYLMSEWSRVDEAVLVDDLPQEAREPIRTAIGDGHWEGEELPRSLAQTVSQYEFARDREGYYGLNPTFPSYYVRSETVSEESLPEDPALYELDSEAIESDLAWELLTSIASGDTRSIRRFSLPTELREILFQYDYLRWDETVATVTTRYNDPGPPYVLQVDSHRTPHEMVSSVGFQRDERFDVSDITQFEKRDSGRYAGVREELEAAADGGFETYDLPKLFEIMNDRLIGVNCRSYRIRISDVVAPADQQFYTVPIPS